MRKQIHPAIEKLGITKRIGWHTVRSRVPSLSCAKCLPSRGKSNRNDRLQVHVSGDACGSTDNDLCAPFRPFGYQNIGGLPRERYEAGESIGIIWLPRDSNPDMLIQSQQVGSEFPGPDSA